MNDGVLRRLVGALRGSAVLNEVSLAPLTTIKTGGPARLLLEASSEEEIRRALLAAKDLGVPAVMLGAGSNVLFPDGGFDGLVIRCGRAFSAVAFEGERMTASAGARLARLSGLALRRGLSGLEFAAGIPGSVGGAALMNAGAFGSEMARVTDSVRCLDPQGRVLTLSGEALGYGYRSSRMLQENLVILSVTLALQGDEPAAIAERMRQVQARRHASQPHGLPSAGSFFKRPAHCPAALLIDRSGLKGRRVGGAAVSEKHAGFLVNLGGASTGDFVQLMCLVQQEVLDREGVLLEPEVRFPGEEARG